MEYRVLYSKKFLKSLDRVKQWQGFKNEKLRQVIRLLAHKESLPVQYRDHALVGDMLGQRECHIAPDILLIYEIDNDVLVLTLINIGNHAQLF